MLDDGAVLQEMRRRLVGAKNFTEVMHVAKDVTVTRLTRGDSL